MNKYFAELLGTLFLVLIGCGSAVIAGGQVGFLGISFAFGLTVLVMVYAIGPISGCHINPAITVAMLVAKKINARDAAGYIVAQCVGAVIGAAILMVIASGTSTYVAGSLGQNGYAELSPMQYSLAAGFTAEVVLTFLFLLVIFGSTHPAAPKGFAGIAIGFALVLIHIVGIPITGTSVNPARSLGPAVLAGGGAIAQLWMFIVAPLLGSILAAVVWRGAFDKAAPIPAPAKGRPLPERETTEV